ASVAIGDLNDDGKPDLAVANAGSDNVSVLLGTGGGSFGAATHFAGGSGPMSAAVGDAARDGERDLACGDERVDVLAFVSADCRAASLVFGSVGSPVPQGTSSAPQSVTITNNGSAPLVVSGFAFTGANPDDFFTGGDSCHSAVAPGGFCSAQVRFAPQAQGA